MKNRFYLSTINILFYFLVSPSRGLKRSDNRPAAEHADQHPDSELPSGGHRGERDGWAWSTPALSTQLLILLKGY